MPAKTADSDLENKIILKLDEKLDLKTGVQNGSPTTVRGPRPLSKSRGRVQAVISKVAPTPRTRADPEAPGALSKAEKSHLDKLSC